jgi:hypothetical protein
VAQGHQGVPPPGVLRGRLGLLPALGADPIEDRAHDVGVVGHQVDPAPAQDGQHLASRGRSGLVGQRLGLGVRPQYEGCMSAPRAGKSRGVTGATVP